MNLSFQTIKANIEKKIYSPVYFLQGQETYYIDAIIQLFEQEFLPTHTKGMNFHIYYGKEQNLKNIIGYARCLPLLGKQQLLIVKEAQEMVDLKNAQGQKILLNYLANPSAHTILIFAYKTKTLTNKTILEHFQKSTNTLFTTPRIYENQIPDWIKEYVQQKGYQISPEAISILQSLLGTDLHLLANELKKIMINLPLQTTINAEIITKHVGMQRAFTPFELQRMVATKNVEKAFQILYYLIKNAKQHPPILITSLLTTFFVKTLQLHHLKKRDTRTQAQELQIHPFFLKDYQIASENHPETSIENYLQVLHEADLQLKGISAKSQEKEILTALLIRLLHR